MNEPGAIYDDGRVTHFTVTPVDELASKSIALHKALGQLAIARRALTEIANRQESEMSQARTLHYDMRGWAQRALEAMNDV